MTIRNFFRTLALLVCTFFIVPLTAKAQFSGSGSGTIADPYIITTAAHLDEVRNNLAAHYRLSTNIDLTNYLANGGAGYAKWGNNGWKPIGEYSDPNIGTAFIGTFDGNNYKVTGLTNNRPLENYVGLFGYTSGASIKNLGIEGCLVTGYNFVGGLAGRNCDSAIENCYTTGYIAGDVYVGGLVGQNFSASTITNSHSSCIITGNAIYVGGLVGQNFSNSTIENCYTTGYIIGDDYVGGLVGGNDSASTINNSHASGSITGNSSCVGGLVGQCTVNSIIENCYATGEVTGNNLSVGGLVGLFSMYSIIENCYAIGNVTGDLIFVGGLVGQSSFYSTIGNSYAIGNVTGGNIVGGLVGYNYNYSIIENCYATGDVTGNVRVGGLVGYNHVNYINYTVENCYATGDVTGNWIVGGLVGGNENSCIKNCVAANHSIKEIAPPGFSYINRIAGENTSGKYTNNYALNTMTGNGNPYQGTPDKDDIQGANATIAQLKSLAFYNTPANWNTAPWDIYPPSGIWKICDSEGLPFFRWQGLCDNDIPTGLNSIYGNLLSSVAMPSGWEWENPANAVGNVGQQTHKAKFTPLNYNAINNIDVTITVNKADPNYSVPTGLTATFGDLLSTVTIPSGWQWVNPTFFVGNAGQQTHKATFTPEDTENYNVITNIDVTITVNKANPNYSVPTGLTATFGDLLSTVTLPTGWQWENPTNTVGNAGQQTHKAKFTPEDTENYNIITNIDVTITVNQAVGSFVSLDPIDVTYSPTLILADLLLPVDYEWNVPQTSLSAGDNQQFAASYTDPSGNYTTAQGNIIVNVAKAEGSFVSLDPIDATYLPTLILADLLLPIGYEWNEPQTSLNAGDNQQFAASYTDASGNYTTAQGNIIVNVAKAEGALVATPTLQLKTCSSITINPISEPTTGQAIEYARGYSNTAPTNQNDWQISNIFDDLTSETQYFIFARAAENENYFVGVASSSMLVVTEQIFIITTSLPDGLINEAYGQMLDISCNPPYTWTITSGSLPNGINLNSSTGEIEGVPTVAGTFNFTVRASNNTGNATQILSIYIGTVGIETISQNGKSHIYPNPTSGKFSVFSFQFSENSNKINPVVIEILDITGRIVHREPFTVNRATIDITHLPNGMYFVKIENETIKIVKR